MTESEFIFLNKLGQGSFSSVYRVKRIADSQHYAIKKDKDKKNALNEIRMLASLSHPNVINYHEAFLDEKTNYLNIVMELAMNGDLASKIKQKFQNGEGFFEFEIWKIVSGILKGLKYLHNAQIVHRDLKPANVFFGENNIVKLGDLNVSRILNNTDLAHTQTGTPNYASPQVWDNQPYSYQCDVWSIGCIIYQMCCFKPPFRSKNMDQLYKKVQTCSYDKIPRRYSTQLQNVIKQCLQKKDKRINIDELIELSSKYTMKIQLGTCEGPSSMLETIHMPKQKQQFARVLPRAQYHSVKKPKTLNSSNPEQRQLKCLGKQQSVLEKFISHNAVSSLIQPKSKLPLIQRCRSEKILQDIRRELPRVPSFKSVLKSVEDAKVRNLPGAFQRSMLKKRRLQICRPYA